MYYRDTNLYLYKILSERAHVYICEALKGPLAGATVVINKATGEVDKLEAAQ